MPILKLFNLSNLFLFLFISYFSQGILYPNGTIFGKLLFLTLGVITLYCATKIFIEKDKPFFIWMIYVFLLMYLVGVLFTYVNEQTISYKITPISYLRIIFQSFMPFFAVYYFSRLGKIRERELFIFSLFLIFINISNFYSSAENLAKTASELDDNSITNNIGYNFVGLFLFIPLISKKPLIAYGGIILFSYYILLSAKRGAIIVGMLLLILNVFYLLKISGKDVRKILQNFLIGFIGIVAVGLIFYSIFQDSTYLQKRLQQTLEGNSSGRDAIYSAIWYAWYNSDSIWNYLFGFGVLSSIQFTGSEAHNDWLQLLVDYGLCGIFIYILFFWGLLRIVLDKNYTFEQRYIVFMFIAYLGVKSLISMGYTDSFATGNALIFVAYMLGKNKKSISYHEAY